ncbi:CBS domain-containing protein [Actinokineospora alba]|uniref:CBS domain-containing protein n=1 Tax=Actinokineospora alba TaxID=504798 RepID=A0A1H0FNP7_9PSEU|nr:CBS domain-containing protein [Actinokineospora alba]TDP69553.1 CBS domain-containing protein [Actinokineospora alba]SDI14353.1 CBS domain-containing protein [Actinokineospora alba]SDN96303.1 CBS domain-containing protein [Actinokineospora alba]
MGTIDPFEESVRSVMSTDVVGIVPQAPLEVALRLMVRAKVRHLPVVAEGECLGVVDESEILWHLWSTGVGVHPVVAEIVAAARYPSVDISAALGHAAALMANQRVDAAIVTDRGRLAGILTVTDILRVAAQHKPG